MNTNHFKLWLMETKLMVWQQFCSLPIHSRVEIVDDYNKVWG